MGAADAEGGTVIAGTAPSDGDGPEVLEILEYTGDAVVEVGDEQLASARRRSAAELMWEAEPPGRESSKSYGHAGALDPGMTRLSKEVIEALKLKGHNQSRIAEFFGVTRQAVSWHLRTYGGRRTPRQVANESWPWETTNAHGKSKVYQRLRDHGEFMLTQGKGMSADKLNRLRSWWRKLKDGNLVVEFDPSIPPIPGVSPCGGFAYRTRLDDDANLLIRVNEHTHLTDEGRQIWCWPTAS